ncbi:hypothetical protein [Terrarubrum flagellatum]|uniref:hypothetical protein n=1 Tax=Terrirubrum flagellatum TaxID=2895980 RepID=UPI00314500D1
MKHSGIIPPACALAAMIAFAAPAQAQSTKIVAIGASNTYAQAVSTSQAWPALLESMLRARGYDVSVDVERVTLGDSSMILQRIDSAVPAGTKVVVYDLGVGRDRERGINTAANKPEVDRRIRAHGAVPIFAAYGRIVGSEASNPSAWIAGDPNHHITPESHARVAAWLLPQVVAALKKR